MSRRRVPADCDPERGFDIPSWSWIAWQGKFSLADHEVAQVPSYGDLDDRFGESYPITEWYTGSEPSSCNRRRITSDWHVDRTNTDKRTENLPEGWTRIEANAIFSKFEESRPTSFWGPMVYRHQSVETEEPTFWYYPFPMPEISESTPFKVPEQTRYLFCQTSKASVFLHDRWYPKGPQYYTDSLDTNMWANWREFDEGAPRIGRMWLHNEEQFNEETGEDRWNATIDVVAITRSSFSGQCDAKDEDHEPYPPKERINVLWVKWEQGIAYRVASGFVNEEDWKRLELKEIDLVLG
jgi:hypothetical protein